MNACRFCSDPEKSLGHYGLIKYGVRHYAHADCGLRVKGVAFLATLTDWQCHSVFPYKAAQDHGPEAVAELVRRSEKYQDDSQKPGAYTCAFHAVSHSGKCPKCAP